MRFKTMVTITSLIFIAAGASFLLQGWQWTYLLIPHQSQMKSELAKWRFTLLPFIYLFGATLVGSGLLVRLIRNISNTAAQMNFSAVLLILNTFLGVLAAKGLTATQPKIGLALAALFSWQAVAYCWWLMKRPESSAVVSRPSGEQFSTAFSESWKQQIHEAAAQQERNRLARELHDSIKQQLFSININAATVQARWENDEGGAKSALESVRTSVREAMAEMEAMLHNLRPAPLETIGLVEALRQQCESLQYRTGANVTAEINDLPANREFPPGAQDAVFRIAQEALANIARHARATNVRVRLHHQTREDEDALWMKIEDDGSGFDVSNAIGMGLTNIRSRVLEMGGELQVESREDQGTSLTVCIPLLSDGSREVKRELRLTIVFAALGFLVRGFGTIYLHVEHWPWVGLPLFLFSAYCCYRAAQAIRQLKDFGVVAPAKILDIQLRLHLTRTIAIMAFMWSLVNWLILEFYWRAFTRQARYPILLAWFLWQLYEVWCVERSLSIQQGALSAPNFLLSIKTVHRHFSFLLLAAVTFVLDMPFFIEYAVFRIAAVLLFAYWLYLTIRLLWFKRQMVNR